MKKLACFILSLAAVALSGCVTEDRSECPVSTATVWFTYMDEAGTTDIFPSRVNTVMLSVFSADGHFMFSESVSQTELQAFQGKKLNLRPGTYRILCWGNIESNCAAAVMDTKSLLSEGHIIHTGSEPYTCFDRLTYAPQTPRVFNKAGEFTLTVPETGTVDETINFGSAHTIVDVIVKDVESGEVPVIELTGVPEEYDFMMLTSVNSVSYQQHCTKVDADVRARFYAANFGSDRNTRINVTRGGAQIATLDLADFLTVNQIDLPNRFEPHVTVIFDFIQAKVTVTIQGWQSSIVSPIL